MQHSSHSPRNNVRCKCHHSCNIEMIMGPNSEHDSRHSTDRINSVILFSLYAIPEVVSDDWMACRGPLHVRRLHQAADFRSPIWMYAHYASHDLDDFPMREVSFPRLGALSLECHLSISGHCLAKSLVRLGRLLLAARSLGAFICRHLGETSQPRVDDRRAAGRRWATPSDIFTKLA